MPTPPRIPSILETKALDSSITGLPTYELSKLDGQSELDFELPTNVRLGHIAERVVGQAIKGSKNYDLLHNNIQILEGKKTIGELYFILREVETEQVIHLELAYKFYLLDPNISTEQ